jgi:hypothetical protein
VALKGATENQLLGHDCDEASAVIDVEREVWQKFEQQRVVVMPTVVENYDRLSEC